MKEALLECMKNAEENGFPVWDWESQDIAGDIIEKTGQFEDESFEAVVDAIETIKSDRSK